MVVGKAIRPCIKIPVVFQNYSGIPNRPWQNYRAEQVATMDFRLPESSESTMRKELLSYQLVLSSEKQVNGACRCSPWWSCGGFNLYSNDRKEETTYLAEIWPKSHRLLCQFTVLPVILLYSHFDTSLPNIWRYITLFLSSWRTPSRHPRLYEVSPTIILLLIAFVQACSGYLQPPYSFLSKLH